MIKIKTLKEEYFIPLTNEYMFKKVFKENPDILKKILICILKLNMNPEQSELIFLNEELPIIKRKEHKKTVNILVAINGKKIIDIEINTDKYSYIKERNTLYIEKIITMEIEKNTSYEKKKDYHFYQLNLNKGYGNFFKDKYFTYKEKNTNEVLTPNIEIIYKSLDYYYNIYNSKNELINNEILWLSLMNSKNFKELEHIAKLLLTAKEHQKLMKSVKEGCREKVNIANWESEKMEALVRKKIEEEHQKYEREKQEQEKKIKEIIKELIKLNFSYKEISSITKKPIQEIEKIKEFFNEKS